MFKNSARLSALLALAVVCSVPSILSAATTISAPASVVITSKTTTSLSASWVSTSSKTAGYKVFLNSNYAGPTSKTSWTFSGLKCGTSYTLGVAAYTNSGATSSQTHLTASTSACPADTTAPSTPSGLIVAASTVSASTGTATWTAASDNVAVTGYDVFLNGTKRGQTTSLAYMFPSLTCGTAYTVVIDAYDAAGNRSGSATTNFTTTACATADTTAPSHPTALAIAPSTITATSGTATWTAATDNVAVTGYDVFLNGTKVGQTASLAYMFPSLTCGTAYAVAVDAYDAAGNHSVLDNASFTTSACTIADTTAPSVPAGLAVAPSAITATTGTATWTAATDNVAVTGYDVFLNGTKRGQTTSLAYMFPSLTCGTAYTVVIDAYDAAGNRSGSATTNFTTTACATGDTTAPTAPTGLTISGTTPSGATVSWSAASDNTAVTGYDVAVNGTTLGKTASLSYAVTGLACETAYTVYIDAYDAAGNKSPLAQKSLTTATCPPLLSVLWSASSFLNTPISNFTLNPNSAAWTSALQSKSSAGLFVDNNSWAAPIYHANGSTPTVTVFIANNNKHITIPYTSSFKPDPSSDSQLAVIDDSTGCEYEFQSFNPATLAANAEGTFHASTGSGLHANDAGVTGSNISVLGGLITAKDVNSGSISHALRYATQMDSPAFVAPATRSDGGTSSGIPAGELMRLDPNLNLSGLGLTPFQLMVAKALQTYGAYNADASGSFKLYAESIVDGVSYSTPVSALPWSVASHMQFGAAPLGSTAVDTNSDSSCNQQH